MSDIPDRATSERAIADRAAALIFDDNGIWLVLPAGFGGDADPAPAAVQAARELAARLQDPDEVAQLARAFEHRRERGEPRD